MRDMLEACDVAFDSDEEFHVRFNDMDKDKDGLVSFDDFKQFLTEGDF